MLRSLSVTQRDWSYDTIRRFRDNVVALCIRQRVVVECAPTRHFMLDFFLFFLLTLYFPLLLLLRLLTPRFLSRVVALHGSACLYSRVAADHVTESRVAGSSPHHRSRNLTASYTA